MRVFFIGSALSELSDVQTRFGVSQLGPRRTASRYRLFSIDDRAAALLEDPAGGAAVVGELGELASDAWDEMVASDPPEIYSGLVTLDDGRTAAAAFASADYLRSRGRDITSYGSFADYIREQRSTAPSSGKLASEGD